MLTIVTWKWRGWRPVYDYRHVNRLAEHLGCFMRIPYRFVCITDDPVGVECETFPLWKTRPAVIPRALTRQRGEPPVCDCFVRLKMFDPEVGRLFGERVLSLDLGCSILGDLAPLITDEPFKAARGYRSHVRGGMWMLAPGYRPDVWSDFDPVESPKLIARTEYRPGRPLSGSDQAWLSIKMPDAAIWDESDGVYDFSKMRASCYVKRGAGLGGWRFETSQRHVPGNARVILFAGSVNPWDPDCKLICPDLYAPLERGESR